MENGLGRQKAKVLLLSPFLFFPCFLGFFSHNVTRDNMAADSVADIAIQVAQGFFVPTISSYFDAPASPSGANHPGA
jgi:hypothetical protein